MNKLLSRKRFAALVLGVVALGTVWAGQLGGTEAVRADPNWGVVAASESTGDGPGEVTPAVAQDPTWG
ncbi:hypothetical protein OHA61_30815 [Streptomyces sp. NBC_00885]|uniref:hypothetical protein n=1 Tax=Streptomyces sp. NBC_00885 TaxID=2975857 RepID=UPI003870A192|nr:hypothetical protein OHA61_30815 [Streptomyces sp. NBC_00885]